MFRLYTLSLLVLLVLTGCSQKHEADEARQSSNQSRSETLVKTVTPIQGGKRIKVPIQGKVKAVTTGFVTSEVSGTVQAIYRELGDDVQAGEVIAKLDTQQLQAQLKAAQASANQSQLLVEAAGSVQSINLKDIEANAQLAKTNLESSKLATQTAQIHFDHAKSDAKRYEQLFAQEAISKQQQEASLNKLEEARSQLQQAHAKQVAAEIELDRLRNVQALQHQARANLASTDAAASESQARADLIAIQLEKANLKAPISGTITQLDLEVGQAISAGAGTQITIVNNKKLEVTIQLADSLYPALKSGTPVEIESPIAGSKLTGSIKKAIPQVNPATGQFNAVVNLPASPLLFDGMNITGNISLQPQQGWLLPLNCLSRSKNGTFVWVINQESKAEPVPVSILFQDDKQILVSGSLEKNSNVIQIGHNNLKAGDPVKQHSQESLQEP